MNQPRKPRVLIVLEHSVQHFVESFRFAARSSKMDVSVLYWTEDDDGRFDPEFGMDISWDVDLRSGYPRFIVEEGSFVHRVDNFRQTLRNYKPDVVICLGWGTMVARLTIAWCVLTRTSLVFFGDSTWQHRSDKGGTIRSVVRSLILRSFFRIAAGALSTGTFNREFYIFHGMHPNRVFECVCPVDVDTFARARGCRAEQPESAPLTIGFAGKLVPWKGVDELLQALALLAAESRWQARIIGEGIERECLEKLAGALEIADRVDFVGFRNTSQMPAEFAGCDIVVTPSRRDFRVLAAVEAMAAGAAVVVSSNTAIWGRGDVLEDGVTGRVYRSGDPSHLAAVLRELIADPDRRAMLQAAGAERALGQGPDAFVAGLERAVAMIGCG